MPGRVVRVLVAAGDPVDARPAGGRRRSHEDGKRAPGAAGRARQGDCGRARHVGRSRSRPCSDRIASTREQRIRMDTRPPDTDAEAPPGPGASGATAAPPPRAAPRRPSGRGAAGHRRLVRAHGVDGRSGPGGPEARRGARVEVSPASAAHRPGVGPADSRRVRFRGPDDRGAHARRIVRS